MSARSAVAAVRGPRYPVSSRTNAATSSNVGTFLAPPRLPPNAPAPQPAHAGGGAEARRTVSRVAGLLRGLVRHSLHSSLARSTRIHAGQRYPKRALPAGQAGGVTAPRPAAAD